MSQRPLAVNVAGYLLRETSIQLDEPFQPSVESRGRAQAHVGGSGANIASNLSVLGVPARLIGTVGNDAVGAQLLSEYKHPNLSTQLIRVGRTAQITTLVDTDGDRTFLVDQGDAHDIGVEHIPPSWLAPARALVLPAFNLYWEANTFHPVGLQLAQHAKQTDIPLVIDAASARLIEASGRDRVRSMLNFLEPNVLSASADEAEALGIRPDDPSTWLAADTILIHRGADPTDVLLQQGTMRKAMPVYVAPVESVVDSNGAGDAFLAGFVANWLQGTGVMQAVSAGHAVAAQQLGVVGPSLPRPNFGAAPSRSEYRVPPPPEPPISFDAALRLALGNKGPDRPDDFGL